MTWFWSIKCCSVSIPELNVS